MVCFLWYSIGYDSLYLVQPSTVVKPCTKSNEKLMVKERPIYD